MRKRILLIARLAAALLFAFGLLIPQPGSADPPRGADTEIHVSSALGVRAVPIGLTLGNDLGVRRTLFDSDHPLLENTFVEPGITTEITPSNGWAGLYVEIVPLAVLQVHASFQTVHYFGTYGYLHVPEDQQQPDWSLDAIDDRADAGVSARGHMATLRARPRVKLGSFVAFVDGTFRWIDMDIEGAYYESTFDMLLEPTDGYTTVVPTAGWIVEMPDQWGWLLAAAGWEHTATLETNLTRDMARGLALWGLPFEVGGSTPELAVLGGYWVDHPNRRDTWYIAGQFSVDWSF